MKKNREQANSVRQRVSEALRRVELHPDDKELLNQWVGLVRSVFESDSTKSKTPYQHPVPMKVLENVALLKISFGFDNRDVVLAISGDSRDIERMIKKRENEITLLANAYAQATSRFSSIKEALTSGKAFEEIDIRGEVSLEKVAQADSDPKRSIPLHMAKALEKVRWSDGFQDGDPDAICLAAEKYMTAGAIEVADSLIEQVFDADPSHPGGWFQKARLLLKKSDLVMRKASHYRFLSEEADVLSAAEQHYEDLASDEAGNSHNLRQEAFDACVKAYSLLPDGAAYEQSAIRWSSDYGTLRNLRHSVRKFIVREAGERCNPYRMDGSIHERINARLGRTKKMVWDETRQTHDWVPDIDEMERLAAPPLFSENTDKMIVAAYKELMADSWTSFDRKSVQLSALNFIRVLMSESEYRQEVADFAESLKTGYAPESGEYFGQFSGPYPYGIVGWRFVLHEHLDSIMSRSEQRALIRSVYDRWVLEVNRRRDEAFLSNYDEEIRQKFLAEDPLGAYQIACMGEKDGIYRRDDGYGALVLTRTAQHAALSLGADSSQSVIRHLGDESLRSVAEQYYDDEVQSWYSDDPFPFPDYLCEAD